MLMSISSRAHARSKSFCDSPNSAPRNTRTTPSLIARLRSGIALLRSLAIVRPNPADAGQAQSGFDRFHQTRPILCIDRDSVLNDLQPHPQPFDFWIDIDPHNCVIDPNAQIPLLLQKLEERAWFRFWGNRHPKGDQSIFIFA